MRINKEVQFVDLTTKTKHKMYRKTPVTARFIPRNTRKRSIYSSLVAGTTSKKNQTRKNRDY